MTRTCYIVDDEFHAIEILSDFITKTNGLQLTGSSGNPMKALEEISTGIPPDITFLDIDMPELSGLEFAGLVNHLTTVIFTTSYREYALEAFEQQALDYLLKPISYERFLKALQRARKTNQATGRVEITCEPFFFVNAGIKNQFVRVPVADISYIAAALNYVEIYIKEQKIVTYMSLREAFSKLPVTHFSRIHKSFIVNHNFINTVEYGQVKMNDKAVIPIGRAFRKDFHQSMKISFSAGKYDQSE